MARFSTPYAKFDFFGHDVVVALLNDGTYFVVLSDTSAFFPHKDSELERILCEFTEGPYPEVYLLNEKGKPDLYRIQQFADQIRTAMELLTE